MADESFYVRIRGKISGPYNVEALQKLVRRGVLSRIHEISGDKIAWSTAGEFEDLFPSASSPSASSQVAREDVRSPIAASQSVPSAQSAESAATTGTNDASPHPIISAVNRKSKIGDEKWKTREKVLLWGGMGGGILVIAPLLLYFLIWRGNWKNDQSRQAQQETPATMVGITAPEHPHAVGTTTQQTVQDEASNNLTSEQIVSRCEKSVALIKTTLGSGTGFIVVPGMLVTNYHVVQDAPLESIQVYFPASGSKTPISVTNILFEDHRRDLVVLEIPSGEPPLALAERGDFHKGQTVTVIGNPGVGDKLILENAVSVGVMSTKTTIQGNEFYQLSIAINPGNSGGPVFNSSGKVVGVVTLKATKQENIAFCIILDSLRSAVAAAQAQTKEGAPKVRSDHNLRAVFSRATQVGEIYVAAMDAYATSMGKAIDDGHSANYGIQLASSAIDEKVADANKFLTDDIKTTIASVGSDPLIPEAMRLKMIDLWANYNEMKSYVDQPRGSYESYRAKTLELRDRQQQLVQSLRLLLGIVEDPNE